MTTFATLKTNINNTRAQLEAEELDLYRNQQLLEGKLRELEKIKWEGNSIPFK